MDCLVLELCVLHKFKSSYLFASAYRERVATAKSFERNNKNAPLLEKEIKIVASN